ncbi:Peroxisomal targeting signal 2 receptor [Colletotrichum sp. SAR 10_99]|nr:Peroxisomal targeting signal 2 receptor [Colletotrichum sp. SAR 10_96]KAI8276692.1 Peroxisomal targeting signal 2 receptor [Colletotrichum sp. SAR 10_98]KAJ5016031.1 Peroxisomal targeting signal 2 receptor [Colletotrichum sp. SAR 10_99]
MAPMLEFRTQGYNPYAVKYSPYYDSRIAVAFDTNDSQYDLAWSEINENQLVVACGDGSIKLFDLGVKDFPVMNFHEHKRETFSVNWSPITKDTFVSASWDGTIKLWSPTRDHSLRTLPVGNCTYSAAFQPSNPSIISAVSSDSQIRIFDLRTPVSSRYHLTSMIPVHAAGPSFPSAAPAEVLTHDWNKYRDTVIATGGVDRAVRTFDIRNPTAGPVSVMQGHEYAVRRLAWSPHAADLLLTASYDMTVRLWDDRSNAPPAGPAGGAQVGAQVGIMNRHTEFVVGVDWCLFGVGGWVATVGWDERVLLWDANALLAGR